jgi:hypothetical protein
MAYGQVVAPGAVQLPVTLVQVFQVRIAGREPQGGGVGLAAAWRHIPAWHG